MIGRNPLWVVRQHSRSAQTMLVYGGERDSKRVAHPFTIAHAAAPRKLSLAAEPEVQLPEN